MTNQDIITVINQLRVITNNIAVEIIPTNMVMNSNWGFFHEVNTVNDPLHSICQALQQANIPYNFDPMHRQELELAIVAG